MKDIGVQIIRVLAMIYIVIYHCLCYYGVWTDVFDTELVYHNLHVIVGICNFSLMSFIFISGFLYAQIYSTGRYVDTKTVIKKKLGRIILPYLGWGLILIMLFPALYTLWNLMYGISHLWFLLVLAVLFTFIILLRQYVLNPYVIGILFILSLIETFFHYSIIPHIPPYFTLRTALYYLPAFLWGIVCVVYRLPERISRWPKGLFYTIFVLLLLFTAVNIYYPVLPLRFYYFKSLEYVTILFIYIFLRYKMHFDRSLQIVNHLDRHSMSIYIMHQIFIWIALLYIPPVTPFMERHLILAPLLLFTLVFLLSWGMSVLMHRNKFLRTLLGG